MNYFVHPAAICESKNIGERTRIWAHTHILPGAKIGKDCNICDHVFIENDVLIGDRVTIKCGVQIWDGARLEDDVFVGPNATFTNDIFPRSKARPNQFMQTKVCKGASIGANSTILPNLVIGKNAMVGAGAVVVRSVPPNAIAVGNPATITGYVGTDNNEPDEKENLVFHPKKPEVTGTRVRGVTIHNFPLIKDPRGNLSAGEFEKHIPFLPKRYFFVFDVPNSLVRGEHAHINCHQFLICAKGSCSIIADDGTNRQEFPLDRPTTGIYVPPMIWTIQYKHTQNTVLVVFASDPYMAEDYIRDYDEFIMKKAA